MIAPFPKHIITRATAIIASLLTCHAAELPEPGSPIEIAGTHGKFDFITVDVAARRLLAAHTGNGSLDVIDMDTKAVLKVISTGAAQDCAVDEKSKRYLVSVSKPPQLAVIDATALTVTATIPLAGPADLMAIHPKSGTAYVGHDEANHLWVVDAGERKVISTVDLPSDSPEGLGFDSSCQRLFQAMKKGSIVAVVDVATNKVLQQWPTAPATSPHGIAMVPEFDAMLVSGGNGKLVMMSQADGHIIASVDIPAQVDQLAYDAGMHRIYCASAAGKIAVVGIAKEMLTKLGEVPSSPGARSIAVDSKTHTVWIAYAKGASSFVQPFAVAK